MDGFQRMNNLNNAELVCTQYKGKHDIDHTIRINEYSYPTVSGLWFIKGDTSLAHTVRLWNDID